MRNIAVLDSRVQEANRRCNEVSGELKFIQASIATLQQEKQKIQHQKREALLWLDHWKNRARRVVSKANGFMQVTSDSVEDSLELAEFTLSDLQSATCDFSESFKIGQGGSTEVYKGEMLGRTVAIKKLHPHNIQKQPEFLHEVSFFFFFFFDSLILILRCLTKSYVQYVHVSSSCLIRVFSITLTLLLSAGANSCPTTPSSSGIINWCMS